MECKDCKYFLVPHNERMGSCKRYPQVVNKIVNDWCGEFSAIEVVKQEIVEEKPVKMEVQWIEPEPVKRKGRPKKNAD